MRPSAALALTVPLVTIPLTISPLDGEDLPTTETTPETTFEDRRIIKRRYWHRNALASGPDGDPRPSRENTLL